MTFDEFQKTLSSTTLPGDLSPYLQALWYDGTQNWNKAHALIQNIEDRTGAWIHAYLHRKEGDMGNADYWYRRAGKTRPSISLQAEWEGIVKALLE